MQYDSFANIWWMNFMTLDSYFVFNPKGSRLEDFVVVHDCIVSILTF